MCGAILEPVRAKVLRAAGTAEVVVSRFQPVSYDLAFAMCADGRESVDRALEAVERMGLPVEHDLEALVVVVAADLTGSHRSHLAARKLTAVAEVPARLHRLSRELAEGKTRCAAARR